LRSGQRRGLADLGIRSGIQQDLNHFGLVLEHGPRQYGLATIVQSVWVCSMLD
jgi:hypothetical protein